MCLTHLLLPPVETHDPLNELILGLYRYGRDVPIADFQRWALERLREVIAFDSAAWGTVSELPQEVHSAYLYGQPRALLDTYVKEGWQSKDFVRAACVANPGAAMNISDLAPVSKWRRTLLYRRFARPHGIEWALCVFQAEPFTSLNAVISLWRKDREQPFSDQDRGCLQVVAPHLLEAMHANHLWQFSSASLPKASQSAIGMGVCDRDGLVHDCSRNFARLIRAEWPGWAGTTLPAALVAAFAGGTFVGKRIDVEVEPLGDQWLLRARAGGAGKQLGARERQVADLYASGMNYHEIAHKVGVAPTTVRNQLRASFKKLGVTSKLDLARRLAAAGTGLLQ